MIYQLENTNNPGLVLRYQDFGDDTPPVLAPEKNLRWVAYVEPTPPYPTPEQIAAELETALARHIHKEAWTRGWDSIDTAASRAGYVNPWQAQGTALGQWRDSCWAHALFVRAEVEGGNRPAPTAAELVAEMPAVPTEAGPVIRAWTAPW